MTHATRRTFVAIPVVLAVVAATVAVGALAWTIAMSPTVGGFSDSAEYIVLADFFRGHFAGSVQLYSANYFGTSRFPPLFPLTLALAGAGMENPERAYWVIGAQSAVALLLLFAWYRQQLRDIGAACALFAAFALLPGWLLLGFNPLSEPLFLALLFACLLVADRWRDGESSPWLLAALVSILPLARSAGLALVIAAIVWFHLHGERRLRLAALSVAMFVPIVAWMAYRRLLPIDIDYSEQVSLGRLLEVFGGWGGWLLGQWPRLFLGFMDNLDPARHRFPIPMLAIVLLFALVGWWVRLRARRLDPLFLLLYMGMIFVWPFPAEQQRLCLVALPLVLLCAVDGARAIASRLRPVTATTAALLVAVLVLVPAFPFLARAPQRLALDVAPELSSHRATPMFFLLLEEPEALRWLELRERLVQVMATLPEVISREDCVYSTSPALAWMATGGRVNIRPTPGGVTSEAQARREFSTCRYFLIAFITSPQHRQPPLYPYREISAWTRPVLVSRFAGSEGAEHVPSNTAAMLLVRSETDQPQ